MTMAKSPPAESPDACVAALFEGRDPARVALTFATWMLLPGPEPIG